jgi:ornithine carbamoyltransferase
VIRHFLDLSSAGAEGIRTILDEARTRKEARRGWPKGKADADAPLAGHVLAMVFEQSSTRTRVSFDIAMRQLGGSALVLDSKTTQLGRGERIADTARVLGRMADAVMFRTGPHERLRGLADHAGVPVINGLTDLSHPCQIVADLLTLVEAGRDPAAMDVAWFGDANNVLFSTIEAAALLGFPLRIAVPLGHGPPPDVVERARLAGARLSVHHDAREAAEGASVLVTDTWVSMGQDDAPRKRKAMEPFRVYGALLDLAADDAVFLHCLPAHIGDEVTEEVFEGAASLVFQQAENRLHAQKAILRWCFGQL